MHNMIRIRIQYFTTRDGNRDIQGTVMGMRGLRLVTRHDGSFGSLFTLRLAVHYHLGELICLVSTFPVNLYFINPPAPGEEEGAKSEEGIRTVPPDTFGVGAAGVAGTLTLVG